jgi:hypothetical protein
MDDIVRAVPGAVLRAAGDEGDGRLGTLVGRLANYGVWYEVDSKAEGRFMESVAPGAFRATFAEDRDRMRVIYDHGQDSHIGRKPIGPLDDVADQPDGIDYAAAIDDTSWNRDLMPGLRSGVYGSSYRFSVPKGGDAWDYRPARSDHNPEGIPERVVREARVRELGPTPFPVGLGTTAGVRSLTDDYRGRASPAEPVPSPEPAKEATVTAPAIEPTPTVNRTDRPARIDELRSTVERFANEHQGQLTADERAQWDGLTAQLRTLEDDERADNERQEFVRARVASPAHAVEAVPAWTPQPFNTPRERVRDIYSFSEIRSAARSEEDERQLVKDSAMRSVEAAQFPAPYDGQSARSQIADLLSPWRTDDPDEVARLILRTGNPAYQRAFAKAATFRPEAMTEHERAAALAVVGTTTTGGYAVPYVFDPTLIHTGAYTNINPFRTICRVEQITGGNVWRGVSVGAIAATYRAEGAAMEEGGPTFALPTYTAQRCDAFVTLSRETLQDRPDITAELASIIGEGKATNEETQFSIGVGTGEFPHGMFVKSKFTVKETITDNTFAVADLDATEAALPIRHRAEAVWMLSRAVIRIIQGWETAYGKLFNSTLGYPAVGDIATNPGGNTGMNLLGYPVWETPSAPATVTGDDTIVGILVSPKNYIIVDRVGMEVELVPNLFDASTGFPTGQRGLMAIWRNTAGPVNADAGRQININ